MRQPHPKVLSRSAIGAAWDERAASVPPRACSPTADKQVHEGPVTSRCRLTRSLQPNSHAHEGPFHRAGCPSRRVWFGRSEQRRRPRLISVASRLSLVLRGDVDRGRGPLPPRMLTHRTPLPGHGASGVVRASRSARAVRRIGRGEEPAEVASDRSAGIRGPQEHEASDVRPPSGIGRDERPQRRRRK